MKITCIMYQESAPRFSAYDPYCPTAFGSIKFKVKGRKVTIHTLDRCAEYVEVGGREFSLRGAERSAVTDFIRHIWYLKEANIELPEVIRMLV